MMPMVVNEITDDIRKLPMDDRAELAHRLIWSLGDQIDPDLDAVWMEEIDRRSTEVREGQVDCRQIGEVVADICRKLHGSHSQSS